MSGYVVLARKWRPAQFDDIVGQPAIVRTLSNAIRLERIHHAYLLTGSRGIGKTSIARIFSKVVRCENRQVVASSEGAPLLRSCDSCASCKEIATGRSMSVLEIDGASNNGVEAIREIREDVKIAPASGHKKIYIIDEVHMLSTAAFNALLKTLEEPPPHVIFIFATTEAHKIPATILGRCQRFDLRRVTVAQIQDRVSSILEQEGITAETGAVALIARAGDGSMRDALSLLDQVIAFAGSHLTPQAVRESIGLIEGQTLMALLSGIIEREPLKAVAALDEAYRSGHDLRVLTRGLIEHLHAAILASAGAQSSTSVGLSDEEWQDLQKLAAKRPIEELELMFQVLHHGLDWIARSPHPKIVLDVLLIKCASAEVLVAPSLRAAPAPAIMPPAPTPMRRPEPAVALPVQAPDPVDSAGLIAVQNAVVHARPSNNPQRSSPKVAPTAPDSPAPAVPTATPTWEGFIEWVRSSRPLLATLLEHGVALRLPLPADARGDDCDLLILGFSPQHGYYREQLQAKLYQDQVTALGRSYFGRPIRIRTEHADIQETVAAKRERVKLEEETSLKRSALEHPLVVEARSLFGGELGPIELKGTAE